MNCLLFLLSGAGGDAQKNLVRHTPDRRQLEVRNAIGLTQLLADLILGSNVGVELAAP